MRHLGLHNLPVGTHDLPAMPPPNPWLMGVVLIGGGLTLWWLIPDAAHRDEDVSGDVWGGWSAIARLARVVRSYNAISPRSTGVLMVIGGLAVLGFQIAQG